MSTLSLLLWLKHGLYQRAALGICTLQCCLARSSRRTDYLGQVISVSSDVMLIGSLCTGLCRVTQVTSLLQTEGRTDQILGGAMNYSSEQRSGSSYDVIHSKSPLPDSHYSSWPLTLQLCYPRSCHRECAVLQGAKDQASSVKPFECVFRGVSRMIREQ